MTRTAKDDIFEFLDKHPGNLTACAKKFGTTRDRVVEVLARYKDDAKAVIDGKLDDLEEQVYLSGLGKARSDFRLTEALKVLSIKRPKEWGGKVIKNEGDLLPPPPPQIASREYIANGRYEHFVTTPVRQPETIRVKDAPGRFFEDIMPGRVNAADPPPQTVGDGGSSELDPAI